MMIQLYEWGGPQGEIDTVDKVMWYVDWLIQERDRLEKSGRAVEVKEVEKRNGKRTRKMVSLWVESYCTTPRCRKVATRVVDAVGMLCDECTRVGGRKEVEG